MDTVLDNAFHQQVSMRQRFHQLISHDWKGHDQGATAAVLCWQHD